jgi:hypothetical protein
VAGRRSTGDADVGIPARGILPIRGIAADRNLAPDYPGISDSDTPSDWDPPFPMTGLIRPKDEAFWREYPRHSQRRSSLWPMVRDWWRSRFWC